MKNLTPLRVAAVAILGSLFLVSPVSSTPQEASDAKDDTTAAEEAPKAEEGEGAKEAEKPAKRKERKRRAIEGTLPIEWVDAFRWRSIGPANMGGRCIDIAVHPTDRSCYWVATASGGLLKTTNSGNTYKHQFDGEATVSIGAIAVSQSHPDVVWVGTGEANPRNSVSWGDGVYKSIDGGATWQHMGLEESHQVGVVVIHPTNPDIVYVGALGHLWGPNEERGLFRTIDGGVTWEKILYVDEDTGVIDALMSPDDPNTLLVATYERRRDEFDTNDPAVKLGDGAALYKTTDGGATFRKLTQGLPSVTLGRIGLDYCGSDANIVYAVIETELISQEPEDAAYMGVRGEDAEVGARLTTVTEGGAGEKAGLKEGDILLTMDGELVHTYRELTKRIRKHVAGDTVHIEVSRDRKTVTVDLTFERNPREEEDKETKEGEEGEEGEAPKKPKGPGPFSGGLGGQRENVQDDQGADGHEFGGIYRSSDGGESWERVNSVNPRPMYYSQVRVDPSDANYVYVLGTSLYRSSDGGKTFTGDGGGRGVHVDHHALWIDPSDGRHMILGNDGGIYVTHDRMENWDHHNHVAIGQFYDITTDGTRDYKVYGGLQDNGSWGGPSRTANDSGPVNTDWISIGGGDGFVCYVDEHDPDLVYYESQGGSMGRTHLRTGEGGYMRPRGSRDVRYRFDWKTPFLLSAHNSKIFYCAGNYVFRSLDRGEGMRRISEEISRTDRGAASALAESPRDHDELYVGTDDGALWATRDGGREWRDLFALNAVEEEEEEKAEKPDPEVITEAHVTLAPGQGAMIELPEDAITGEWTAQAEGEGIDKPEDGVFHLSLELGSEGKVAGILDSMIGGGDIQDGKFDAETGALRFKVSSDEVVVSFEATVEESSMTGSVLGPAGSFHYTFEAKRDEARSVEDVEAKLAAAIAAPPEEEPVAETPAEEVAEAKPEEEKPAKKKAKRKFIKNTIDQLLPGRFRVTSLVASKHKAGRVYAAFDGHFSDDYVPHVFASEDFGESWKSIRANLPDHVGSVRIVVEDPENADLLYLGTEFGAYVSIDRGESWTHFNGNLPTVAVHDFEVNEATGELVAGTHGRSVWIADVTALRQMNRKTVEEMVHLYDPKDVILWKREHRRGRSGTRSFVGQNPSTSAGICYSLGKKTSDIELTVTDLAGNVLQTLEAPGTKGLHRVTWDMRGSRTSSQGRRRGYRRASPGTYVAVLRVGEQVQKQQFEVQVDPGERNAAYLEYERENEELNRLRAEDGQPTVHDRDR